MSVSDEKLSPHVEAHRLMGGIRFSHEFAQTLTDLIIQRNELDEKLQVWKEAELALSAAYLRLREIIGEDAFRTPYGPTREQVWETTENALRILKQRADGNQNIEGSTL